MAIIVESFAGHDINDTAYQAYFEIADEPYASGVDIVTQQPIGDWSRFVRAVKQSRTLPVHINLISGDFQSGWETLAGWFRPGTMGELVVTFGGGISRALDAVVRRVMPYDGSPNHFTVVLFIPDARWRSADVQRTTTAITASPTTFAITNDGNTPDTSPKFIYQPYSLKAAASTHRYFERVIVANLATRAMPMNSAPTGYAVDLTGGGWNHAAEVAAGRSDSTGKDVRTFVDGQERDRWDGEHADNDWNSAATKVWGNLVLAPRKTLTVRTATTGTSPLNGGDIEVLDGEIDDWAEFGRILIGTEVIHYQGKTAKNANGFPAFQNVIRGYWGTTAAVHAVADMGYWVEHDIIIVHGWTAAPTYTERTETKPLLDLTSNTLTNSRHEWTQFADSRYPGRSMQWYRTLAGRDDQYDKIVAPTGAPSTDLTFQYYGGGAQASKPVDNQWEIGVPAGIGTGANSLSYVRTQVATMGLRALGEDVDGNEVTLATNVGAATASTQNVTPASAQYRCRFWGFNSLIWNRPAASYGNPALTTTQTDNGQRILIGDEPVVLTNLIVNAKDVGAGAFTITAAVYSDDGAATPAPYQAISGASGTGLTDGAGGETAVAIALTTPPTLQPHTYYWVTFKSSTAAGSGIYTSAPGHMNVNNAQDMVRAAGTTNTAPGYCFTLQLFGYQGALASTLQRLDGVSSAADASQITVASVTLLLDNPPYVAMGARQDLYFLDARLRNVTTGRELAFLTPLSLLDKLEVDVGGRAIRNLSDSPFALTLSTGVITDAARASGGIAAPYVLSLTPAGQWELGEAAGNALDTSGNGNNGTVTLGAGARHAAALDAGGDGAITFDAANTKVTVTAAAALTDLWDGGGTCLALINATAAGEGGIWAIANKANPPGWSIDLRANGPGAELHFYAFWSGSTPEWKTSAQVITFGTPYLIAVTYNADSTANDPTVYIGNLSTGELSVLTVGSGLTEVTAPVGARTSDAAVDFRIGNDGGSTQTFNGRIDEVALLTTSLTFAQVLTWLAKARATTTSIPGGIGIYEAGRAQLAVHDLFTAVQGAVAVRRKMGFASTQQSLVGSAATFCCGADDNNNNAIMLYVSSGGTFRILRGNGTSFVLCDQAAGAWASGASRTEIGAWTATTIKAAQNGAAFTSAAATSYIPTLPATADIGRFTNGNTLLFCSNLLWMVTFGGTLTDADSATLNAYGDTLPDPDQLLRDLSPEALPTALYWCDNDRFFRITPGDAERPSYFQRRGDARTGTVKATHPREWIPLRDGANRLVWEETGVLGANVETLMMDRWS